MDTGEWILRAHGYDPERRSARSGGFIVLGLIVVTLAVILAGCDCEPAHADEVKASYYSIESLKAEGSWAKWKGVMKNGARFTDSGRTCATWICPIGSVIRIINLKNGKRVLVRNTDRTSRRFANTRVDLAKGAFAEIAPLEQGIVLVQIEVVK